MLPFRRFSVAASLLTGCLAWSQTPAPRPPAASLQGQVTALHKTLADWPGLNVFGSDDTEIPAPKPGENRVVFLGDDLTAHWGKGDIPFFPGKPYINRGIEKQVTPQLLIRFRQDVLDLQPKVVVIQGGFNDIGMVMGPGSEGTIVMNLRSIMDLARLYKIKMVLTSLHSVCNCYDPSQTRLRPVGKIAGINATLRDLAKEYDAVYLDYYKPLIDPDTRQLKKEYTNNGVDLNAAAYAVLAPLTEKAIADALKQ